MKRTAPMESGKPGGVKAIPLALVFASDAEKRGWSYGRVTGAGIEPGGLSDPRIFGHDQDYRCQCNRLVGGTEIDGQVCANCGVSVGVAAVQQTRRCAHIELAAPIQHPWNVDCLFQVLCVVPLRLRSSARDEAITMRYQRILELDSRLRRMIEKKGDSVYDMVRAADSGFRVLHDELQREVNKLIDGDVGEGHGVSLSTLLEMEFRRLGEGFLSYARGIGIAFRISTRV